MADLDTSQKAAILNDAGSHISANSFTATSSNPAIANPSTANFKLWVDGIAPGTATITVNRNSDGMSAVLEVTVAEAPFTIHLGTPVPR